MKNIYICSTCGYKEELPGDGVTHHNITDCVKHLEAENKRLREALEFYADDKNYKNRKTKFGKLNLSHSQIELDDGSIARDALKDTE